MPTAARLGSATRTMRTRLRPAGPVLVRAAVCLGIAVLLSLPLAFTWAVTHTEVREQIGTSPTTFSLTTGGHSELRLGIAGTVYVPQSWGPVGLIAQVEGPGDPGAGDGDLANYVRPEMLQLYTGLFHDPQAAVDQYIERVEQEFRRQMVVSCLVLGCLGGVVLFGLSYLLPLRHQRAHDHWRVRIAGSVVVVLVATTGLAWVQVTSAEGNGRPSDGAYALTVLDGTLAAGSTTNSPLLRALLGGALAKSQVLVDRQEAADSDYRTRAEAALRGQASAMSGPREGELAVLMQSDMHCNTTMIKLQRQVRSMLTEEFGAEVPAALAIAGDLTTNGTAAEGTCIRDEAAIAGDRPVAAIIGNHESDTSLAQMKDADMTVLEGETEDVGGVRILGDGDPARTELFGPTALRGTETQADVGTRLFDVASEAGDDRPDLVLMHEAYSAAAFLDVGDMREFLDGTPRDLTTPVEDDVRDLPAGAIFYGHWHRDVPPAVVWNSDGTWTLVMELDTSGGAVATPTLTDFSTPWTSPAQAASFPVIFLDEETRLVTGYQLYRFTPAGEVEVEPRVEVGVPPSTA
ncbi:metallophosphoesterase [Nocardioides sp. R-C-SC26]|uniref:metallophosphoesterase family protein n=1 Tax=Nocardioides sp. R-C-SC26 TaxID=2870414 RepID=UPI001E567A36|nr:metallophosphoesterase family protein [Nocardioides sp. R-C-SC26]